MRVVMGFAVLWISGALVCAAGVHGGLNTYDEGIVLTGGMLVGQGALPHRDFYSPYAPGQYAMLAALFKLFGDTVAVERWLDCVWRGLIAAMAWVLTRQMARTWPAAAAVWALSLIFLINIWFYGYPLFPAFAAALISLYAFAALDSAAHRTVIPGTVIPGTVIPGAIIPAMAGLFAAVTVLFRYDVGILLLLLQGGMLAVRAAAHPGLRPITVRDAAIWCAAAGLPLLPCMAFFATHGMLSGWLFDTVTFPAGHFVQGRWLPWPGAAAVAAQPELLLAYAPLPVAGLAAYALRAQLGTWRTALLCLACVLFYAKGVVRFSPLHLSGAIILSFILAGCLANRGSALALRLLAIGLLAVAMRPVCLQVATVMATSGGGLLMSGAAAPVMPPDEEAAVGWVKAHSGPDDRIYVGLAAHDRIFINDVAFYFLADRRPATHWHLFDPDLQDSLPVQRDIIGELTRHQPALIVLESGLPVSTEPNDSSRASGVRELDLWLAAHGKPAAAFGAIRIFRPVP